MSGSSDGAQPADERLRRVTDPGGRAGEAGTRSSDTPTPAVIDLAAAEAAAAATPRAERAARDGAVLGDGIDEAARYRMLAASDRAAAAADRRKAAADRRKAAADRRKAASYLRAAYIDPLTGALTRAAGQDQLGRLVDRARRTHEPVTFAFLDVDYLKRLNDTCGHAAGDDLLRTVGAALRRGLRSSDIIVRYGGDEFVCALPDSQLADANRRFTMVRHEMDAMLAGSAFSIGLVQLRDHEPLDGVIARADLAMYASRRRGYSAR